MVTTPSNAATGTTQYMHRDHLGSVDTITDAAGAVVQRMSFDAWGKRRDIAWTAMSDANIALFNTAMSTTRGFTGHEMIDPVGLIHMNGRVGACPGQETAQPARDPGIPKSAASCPPIHMFRRRTISRTGTATA